MKKSLLFICLCLSFGTMTLVAQDQPDEKINDIIRKHGLEERNFLQ